MKSRIHFITLGVRNLEKSRNFYRRGLGFRLWKEQGDIVFFDVGDMILALYPYRLLAKDAGLRARSRSKRFPGITISHNVLRKNDVDRSIGLAVKAGGLLLKSAEDTFWGGRSGYFSDPDGYPWEIAWNPFIRLSKSGKLSLPRKG